MQSDKQGAFERAFYHLVARSVDGQRTTQLRIYRDEDAFRGQPDAPTARHLPAVPSVRPASQHLLQLLPYRVPRLSSLARGCLPRQVAALCALIARPRHHCPQNVVSIGTDATCMPPKKPRAGFEHTFVLRVAGGEKHVFAAEDHLSMQDWVQVGSAHRKK